MSKALIKIKEVKHPISQISIGFRIQAAVPNLAGRNFKGQPIPSFAKKYLISESSDHTNGVKDKEYLQFTSHLREFLGYTEFEVVSVPK